MEVIAAVSDTHINSTVGLRVPTLVFDDGDERRATKAQRWMWDCWLDYWDTVDDYGRGGAVKTMLLNGDAVEGDAKGRSSQLVSTNPADILKLSAATIEPGLIVCDRAFFLRGTGAHGGKSGYYEEALAADSCGAVQNESGCFAWWFLLAEFGGVLTDVLHHATMGRQPWTATNSFNALAARLVMSYAGRRLPAIALRSHNHRHADTYDNYPIRVIALPAWQLATEYSYRLGFSEPADIGGIIILAEGGQYEVVKKIYKPEPPKIWTGQSAKAT